MRFKKSNVIVGKTILKYDRLTGTDFKYIVSKRGKRDGSDENI